MTNDQFWEFRHLDFFRHSDLGIRIYFLTVLSVMSVVKKIMKKIKVAHIITKLELGGAQQNTIYTVRHLGEDRYETILISGKGGILDQEVKINLAGRVFFFSALVREISPFKDLLALFQLVRILKKQKIDIVHTHSSKAGILGRWAAHFAGVPIIVHTFHGFGFNDYQFRLLKSWLIKIEQVTALITHWLVFVSQQNIKKAEKLKIGHPAQYRLIHSGIKIEDFRTERSDPEELRKQLFIGQQDKVVGMVGCFKPQKAPLDFIRVARRVKEQMPETRFILVGDGELRPRMEFLVESLGLRENFSLPGWRREMPKIMSLFDVVVLTSLWEGLPRTIPEAMLMRKPLVVTDIDGNRDLLKDGVNGFLVSPHDIAGFADRIVFLLKNPEQARRIGKAGYNSLDQQSDFNIDIMVERVDSLYQELLTTKSHKNTFLATESHKNTQNLCNQGKMEKYVKREKRHLPRKHGRNRNTEKL